jgi:hypothetical protein
MKREAFSLMIVSAAAAYLFYYVLASGGSRLAGLSAALVVLYLIAEWSQFFYRLGRSSASK